MSKTNNHITLLAKLGIDTSDREDIQRQLDSFSKTLSGLTVKIGISKEAIKALEKLSNMDFSKFSDNAKKATDGITSSVAKTKAEVDKILKQTGESLGMKDLFSKEHALTDIESIKRALQKLNPNVKVDFDVVEGQKNLKKIKASFEKDGITTHINFKQDAMMSNKGQLNSIWIPHQIQEVHKELSVAAKSTEDFRNRIRSLTLEGKITVEQFKQLSRAVKETDVNSFGKLNADLSEMVLRNKNAAQAIRDQAKALKEQELEQKRIIENDIKRKNLVSEIERAMRAQKNTFSTDAGRKLIIDLGRMDISAKDFNTTLKRTQSELNQLKALATETSRTNIGLIDSFKIAMTKFPIWMAATTIFYSSIRTAREFMSIIVDIDTKMTSLAKVMSADTDFEKLFDSATASAERFGQSISQVLDAYTEFGRQGFKGQELVDLSNIGLVAANVGEITSQKAAEYLTATIIQWQMEVSEGSKVIDSWNEISNNYSTTLEKLAQGHSRAAASAKAMNIDFNQTNAIIGSLTAATKQSGTEIGNFLKNVLPRLVGQPGQDALAMVGVKLSDDDGNIRDVVEVYTEVANKVKDLTEVERITVTEGLAGKHHLTRMQILLNDLGSANSLYRQMYETSVNSVGSANEENERYMNSLQARINLARVEIEKLAIAMGEAFLTEGMIQSLKAFSGIMGVLSNVSGTIGALPIILATVGVGVTLLSTKFKALVGSMALTSSSFISTGVLSAGLGAKLTALTARITMLGASMKALLASTGVGVALLALGVGIEYVLRNMTKMRETQEKIDAENRAVSESYLTSRDSIKELTKQYSILQDMMQNNPSLETQQRYYEVQNELAVLMPSLIAYEDSYGNSILQSSGVINSKIKLLEAQVEAEERLLKIQQDRENKEKLELSQENVKSYNILADDTLGNFENAAHRYGIAKGNYVYKEEIKNLQDMEKAIIHYETMRVKYAEEGNTTLSNKMARIADDLIDRMGVYQLYTTEVEIASNYLAQAALKDAETVINAHTKMNDSAKELASNMLNDFIQTAESGEEIQIFANVFKDDDIHEALKDASFAIETFKNATDDTFNGKKSNLEEYGEALKKVLSTNLKNSDGDSLGENSTEYINAANAVDTYIAKLILAEQTVREYAETNNVSIESARAQAFALDESGESSGKASEELQKYVASLKELSSGAEQVAGVSAKLISDTEDLIFSYENLTSATVRTAEQELALIDTKQKLALLYPHLVKEGELRIDSLKAESKAQDILLKAVEASKKNLLTAEEEATVKQFTETNARIRLINANIAALDDLTMAYYKLSQKAQIEFDELMAEGVTEQNKQRVDDLGKALMRLTQKAEPYASKLAELASLEGLRNTQASGVLTALDRVEKAQDKTAKSTEKSTKESIYITDKYKQALEAVNAEIEKQQLLRNGMTTYSKEYRASLQQEIKLEQDKKKLLIEQAAALEKQIKSGKVQQTGTITSSSTSKNLNGWDGTITSSFGMRNHPISGVRKMHEGTDIDGVTGQRLDANISGKVIASGNSKQTGYASSYGNIVVVQDDKGVKHIYAHLDKAIAKLGETIVAGMQIGTIGETGSAKGSHLHYETRNASGKAIDSASYVSAAKSGKVSSSSTPSSITTEQQAIDQIQSDLVRIKAEIPKIDNNISSLEVGVINSYLEEFNQKKETYQRILDFENEKIKTLDTSSARYGATLDRNKDQMAKMQDVNRAQLAFLEKLINSGTLSAETLDTMKISAEKLKIEMQALNNAILQSPIDKIDARMGAFDEEIDDIQFLIDRSKAISGLMDEGSADYNNEIEYQLNLLKQNQTAITNKTNELKKLIRTEKLNIEIVKGYKEQLEDLALEYWNLEGVIKDTEASLKDSNDKLASETADKLISAYKDYISQKRDMHIRSIDDDMKAEDKRHKRVMDNYRDEMDAYQKIIQDKLDSIDREESEYDYAKEMNELEKERLEVLRKINLLSLDQSLEAKAERKGLNEELEKIDDTIATKRRKKEADDRKGNLNEMLEEKREQISKQEKMESDYHEREKERIDDLKEYWDQFYTDQLNDEVKFAQIKADIVAGNFDELSAEFKEYMDEMKATMPELENTLDGTMKAVGLSIRQNIITSLQEAIDKLKEIQDGSSIGNSSYSSSSNSSKANSPPLGAGDAQVLTGKFLFEEVSLQADSPYLKKQIRDKADALAASGRKAGSAISSDVTLKDALAELTDKQKKEFGNYLLSTGVKQVSSSALQKLIRDYGSKLASLNTGGYTGSFSGGKVGILHEEEVILNKKETKDFFKYASVLETLQRLISPLKMSPIRQPELNSVSATPSISLEFHVDKMIANESTAKSLAQTVLSEVQNTLKRERGIR
ncbi:phage tail tape measure protein [Solibacillus sp. FSL H8-0523]|uniref:phage tail tape measure protein n=1 Tax=Solibacillus sp. FSL H8-0523 TaxID=2954511 RepID=UPI003100C604